MRSTSPYEASASTLAALWPQDRAALAAFGHAAHIRIAREYLLALPLPIAFGAFARDLQALTRRFDAEAKFHRTITLAWLLVVADRMFYSDRHETWDDFAAANEDLLTRGTQVINEFYRAETLSSAEARACYLLPDGIQ